MSTEPEPTAAPTNYVCQRCGYSTPIAPFNAQGLPGPRSCPMIYNGPTFPADAGHPTAKVGGPCNGVIKAQ